ncbi:MAG TPA: phosphoribosylamine--glycine ligase [Rhodanobacteraceae bacterium]|nr:phosphoribosylamine--glycine ligase [Rhodanobacteraceae bacterium]
MKVLVIGSGGREHALAWKLRQSAGVDEVIVAPGNAGTAREPGIRNADVAATDIDGLIALVQRENIGLTVVGPEGPLVAGVVDRFRAAGLACFGPTRIAAQLEGSKAFTKDFLHRHNIPTAAYEVFTDLDAALAYVRRRGAPIVIKADGLAAGKGVIVALTLADAEQALRDMLGAHAFGDASARVVVEEFLDGEEASYIVMSDGVNFVPMATSQDHKRRDEGDLGPNTGGMGAYSPAPVVTADVERRILEEVIRPTLAGMAAEGAPFAGFLYAGLMIGRDGAPKVIEFNVRFGDPETQPIMMRLDSDLANLVLAALEKRLEGKSVRWDPRPAIGVVIAAHGYPAKVRTGDVIEGLDVESVADVKVFHAGTREENGNAVSAGGRVLTVCALGRDLAEARDRAYAAARGIRLDGAFYRRDIGHRALRK